MPIYYHASVAELPPGTLLQSRLKKDDGRYQVLKTAYFSDPPYIDQIMLMEWVVQAKLGQSNWMIYNWTKEVIYEHIRETEFPNLYGRFGSLFLWEDVKAAIDFQSKYLGGGFIYECSTENDQSPRRFDQGYWNTTNVDIAKKIWPQLQLILDDARGYYSQTASPNPVWEIVTQDPVCVVGKVR